MEDRGHSQHAARSVALERRLTAGRAIAGARRVRRMRAPVLEAAAPGAGGQDLPPGPRNRDGGIPYGRCSASSCSQTDRLLVTVATRNTILRRPKREENEPENA